MPLDDHNFHGQPLAFAIQGFAIIEPGQTVVGPFFCIGPLDDSVIIDDATSLWGGSLNGKTLRVSVYGYFESITVNALSPGTLIAYRTN